MPLLFATHVQQGFREEEKRHQVLAQNLLSKVDVTKFVRKEGSGQGWLVKTRVNFIYR